MRFSRGKAQEIAGIFAGGCQASRVKNTSVLSQDSNHFWEFAVGQAISEVGGQWDWMPSDGIGGRMAQSCGGNWMLEVDLLKSVKVCVKS